MRRRLAWIWFFALITFGSGRLSLLSVMNPGLCERATNLEPLFPLEFLHLSRFVTIVLGFALIVSSVNIYKRKKRAFQFVCALASLSVIFHLLKDLNYAAAILSMSLLVALILARKNFTVKSSIPDLRSALLRFVIAIIVASICGIVGFWLLDKRDFGINFTLSDSIQKTMQFLTLQGNPDIVPFTRYARWFLDSIYLITAITLGYALFALFRPVRYRYITLPREREQARLILENYGRHSIDYFKL